MKKFLKDLQWAFKKEYEESSALRTTTTAPAEAVIRAADRKIAAIPISFLETMCETADASTSPILAQLIADSLSERRDYRPEDRLVVLSYLAKLPKLILVAERMGWFDVNEPLVVAAWKKIKLQGEKGVLGTAAYRFAILAAGKGLKDGLITLADSANMRRALPPSAQRDALIKTDATILRALVPSQLEGKALTDFILKNKATLVFDQEKKTYALKP
ncbi:MAG TPA: hypothetical protein VHO24_21060 [Opitutaceae bacterium]|nr:hypothetical protein [Opitutaceae bacterium]